MGLPISLALNSDGDLSVDSNVFSFVSGIEYVAQCLKIRLQFFLGEWFLNTTLGVPYFQEILVKNPNRIAVNNYIKMTILKSPNIKEITQYNADFNVGQERKLKIQFSAITDYGVLNFNETFAVV
jgi:hypothetical protein